MAGNMKCAFHEENMKMSPVSAACAADTQVGGFREPAIVRSEVMVRPGAVGRLRRTARMLIAAACAAAVLAAASAAAAPADGAVLAASAGAGQTAAAAQTVTNSPARGLGEPAAARDTAISAMAVTTSGPPAPSRTPPRATGNQAGPTHSRTAWGPIEIAAGVLIICFAVLAVQAARRRGR